MARKIPSQTRPGPTNASALQDDDARPGRVGGGHVAFGAPGPAIDMDRVLQTWRNGTTVGGGMSTPTDAPRVLAVADHTPRETVALSDGTRISFTVAGALLTIDDAG